MIFYKWKKNILSLWLDEKFHFTCDFQQNWLAELSNFTFVSNDIQQFHYQSNHPPCRCELSCVWSNDVVLETILDTQDISIYLPVFVCSYPRSFRSCDVIACDRRDRLSCENLCCILHKHFELEVSKRQLSMVTKLTKSQPLDFW